MTQDRDHGLAATETAPDTRLVALRDRVIEMVADVFADAGRALGGDMRAAALLAALGQAALRARRQGCGPDVPAARAGDACGMTASALAEVTGIARETVRRKLVAMQKAGWVDRRGALWLLPGNGAGEPVPPVVADLQRRQIHRVVAALTPPV